MKTPKYDFFISHASENKEGLVKPLAQELEDRGYRVWYDEFELKIGDSLIREISEGIKNSLYGILILSPDFLQKTWTRKELEALLNKESITGENLILPIWYNLDLKDVYEFSPMLVDKVAIKVSEGEFLKIIKAIESKTEINKIDISKINEIISFLSTCSEDRRKKYLFDAEARLRGIFLYQTEYYNWLDTDEAYGENDEWDDVKLEIKDRELLRDYNIPLGVWVNHDIFPEKMIDKAAKLLKKWIYRRLNHFEALELFHILDEELDTDIHYILYGISNSNIKNSGIYVESLNGIENHGIKNSKNRTVTNEMKTEAQQYIMEKYYGIKND